MSNRKAKKLSLKAEVLRVLDARELASPHGGHHGLFDPLSPQSHVLRGRCQPSSDYRPCPVRTENGADTCL